MTSARAEAVRTLYEGYATGGVDLDRYEDMVHPGIEWQTNWPGLAPAVHGIEGVRRYLEVFLDTWEWVHSDVRELVEADDDTLFIWSHIRARGGESGAEIEMDIFDVLTFRDGQIVLRRTWPDRAPAAAAAGLEVE